MSYFLFFSSLKEKNPEKVCYGLSPRGSILLLLLTGHQLACAPDTPVAHPALICSGVRSQLSCSNKE